MSRQRLDLAATRMAESRALTSRFLDEIDDDAWFWQPHEGVTHVAWQVGHLASAEYALRLSRPRGVKESDEELIPEKLRKMYGRGSTPDPDPSANYSPQELRRALDAVHAKANEELSQLSDADLDVPLDRPHPVFKTVLGAVEFAPQHEMIHWGQMALLRRLKGASARW